MGGAFGLDRLAVLICTHALGTRGPPDACTLTPIFQVPSALTGMSDVKEHLLPLF